MSQLPVRSCFPWPVLLILLVMLPFPGCGNRAALEAVSQGDDCYEKGDLDGAIAHFTEAIHLDPKCAVAYNNRGAIYKDKREFTKAVADFDAAIRLDPGYADAYFNRGVARVKQGHLDQAIADYTEVLRLKPHFVQAYLGRANAYEEQGEKEKAEADRQKAKEFGAQLP